jgi:HK97 family phage major capsid protein
MNPLEYVLARMKELKPTIDTLAAIEDKDMTPEQRSEWSTTNTEWDALEARRADLEERQLRAKAAGQVNFNVNVAPDPFKADLRNMSRPDILGAAKTAVNEVRSKFVKDEHAESVTRFIDRGGVLGETVGRLALTTATDEYREAWLRAMAGQAHDMGLLQRASDEYRAMTAGTGNTGGYMVPLFLDPTMVITGAGSCNPFRKVSNVKTINTLTYNGATAAQITAGLLGEAAAFTDNSPTVSQVTIPTYKIGAYIPASFEAFEDIDALASDVLMLFSDAKDNYEASQFATGSGSAPHGVVTDVGAVTASRVAPTTGGAYAAADVYKLHQGLPARYRYTDSGSRAWVGSVATIDSTRQFGTANNYANFLVDMGSGAPTQLLGDPILEASQMSSSYTTGQDVLLYGDFSRFYIIDRIGMSTEFIPNLFDQSTGRPSGQRAWLMHWRVGSGVADTGAFRLLRL